MMAYLWKNVGGKNLLKHKCYLGEIVGLHRVCEDSARNNHSSIQVLSPRKLCHKVLQLYIVEVGLIFVIKNSEKLCNVTQPQMVVFLIHFGLVVSFIHMD